MPQLETKDHPGSAPEHQLWLSTFQNLDLCRPRGRGGRGGRAPGRHGPRHSRAAGTAACPR